MLARTAEDDGHLERLRRTNSEGASILCAPIAARQDHVEVTLPACDEGLDLLTLNLIVERSGGRVAGRVSSKVLIRDDALNY